MSQPLVTRPGYGEGRAPVAEAKLPEGDPSGRGLSLDSELPGSSTFSKPEDDKRETGTDDESMFRVDNADDLTKDQSRSDTNFDNADKHDGIGFGSPGKQDASPKTKYPYRDGRPNAHNASFVAHAYMASRAHVLVVPLIEGTMRVATKLDTIETGLNPKVKERAAQCSVTLKRADIPNLRWLFSVDCGNGPKVVKVKAERSARVVQFPKMDLHLTCSCPAWRWLGPEHHSKREEYIDGKPRGTASVPVIRDPKGINRVCKHVEAVLGSIRSWQIPAGKSRQPKSR